MIGMVFFRMEGAPKDQADYETIMIVDKILEQTHESLPDESGKIKIFSYKFYCIVNGLDFITIDENSLEYLLENFYQAQKVRKYN